MNDFQSTIDGILKDIDVSHFSRSDFLAECALSKISKRNRMYNERFDKALSRIESDQISNYELERSLDSLKSLSKFVTESCVGLTKLISQYEKLISKSD